MRKHDLIFEILKANARYNGTMFSRGFWKSWMTASASSARR